MEKETNGNNGGLKAGRVVVNLTREELEFIDNIGRDALFTTGKRLTNNKIIRAFINVMQEIKIKGDGLYSSEELKNRILVKLGVKREQRTYPRFQKELAISWRKASSEEEYRESSTIEIGEGGIRMEIKENLKNGENIEVMINDPYEPYNPIVIFGTVSWVKKRDEDSSLETGVRITHIPDKDRPRFSRLLYKEFYPDFYTNKTKKNP